MWFQRLTVEPRGVREYRHSASRDSLTSTSLQPPSIVDLGKVLYKIQGHLNYCYTFNMMISYGNLILPCSYCVWCPLVSCFWYLSRLAYLLWSPARYTVKTLYLLSSEKLQLSPPQKLPISYVFLWPATHHLPHIWDHKLVSDIPAPTDLQYKLPFWDSGCLYVYVHYIRLLGCVHKIWNYEEWNLRLNFVTEFVGPAENTGILDLISDLLLIKILLDSIILVL